MSAHMTSREWQRLVRIRKAMMELGELLADCEWEHGPYLAFKDNSISISTIKSNGVPPRNREELDYTSDGTTSSKFNIEETGYRCKVTMDCSFQQEYDMVKLGLHLTGELVLPSRSWRSISQYNWGRTMPGVYSEIKEVGLLDTFAWAEEYENPTFFWGPRETMDKFKASVDEQLLEAEGVDEWEWEELE